MKKYLLIGIFISVTIFIFIATYTGSNPSPSEQVAATGTSTGILNTKIDATYTKPELVTIQGYSGPQQDPNISPDGKYLFFDSHNDAGMPMYIYMAKRIDYKTFKYVGRVPGVDFEGVEGMEDSAHNFYMVSPILLKKGGAITIGRGKFSGGSVTGMAPITGISPESVPKGSQGMTYDLYITPNGKTLYFSDFVVNAKFRPQGAQLAMATKNADGSFTRAANSDEILKNVNGLGALVYNAASTADGLTLAFNAAATYGPLPKIYIAKRTSTAVPFGKPALIEAAEQGGKGTFSESPSFSLDGKHMYFHRVLDDKSSQLFVLTRK